VLDQRSDAAHIDWGDADATDDAEVKASLASSK